MLYKKIVVFDLDDTLYNEVDFLKSAYKSISRMIVGYNYNWLYEEMLLEWRQGLDVFEEIEHKYLPWRKHVLLDVYRYHFPEIVLEQNVFQLLHNFTKQGIILGIITDGRSITQMNKIKALGLDSLILDENIFISESIGYSKLHQYSFLEFISKYPNCEYFYIGDNIMKDFVAPNTLGWTTIGVKDNGKNIHRCSNQLPRVYKPKFWIENLMELNSIINNHE